MKHPKSENILKVINNFKKIIKKYPDGALNMFESSVNRSDRCGTVHCHGGWYAVAACDLGKRLGYSDGADKMAQDLGFEWRSPLKNWADQDPILWGNEHGFHMFCQSRAFFHPEKRPEGAENLQDIVDHWEEVYERVKQGEESNGRTIGVKND